MNRPPTSIIVQAVAIPIIIAGVVFSMLAMDGESQETQYSIVLPLAYLLGSISWGYMLLQWKMGVDVREYGSGRTGMSNVLRTGGVKSAAVVLTLDIAKGVVAVVVARVVIGTTAAEVAAGLLVLVGHNWPVFLRFKGGGGGITAGACLVMLNWVAGAITVPLAILALYLSRYASVGTLSVGGGGLLVLLTLRLAAPGLAPTIHLLYGLLAAAWIVWALRPNIRRLLRGTERRITLW